MTILEKNRGVLINLIFELKRFTLNSLIEAFRNHLNWTEELDPAIDGTETISAFLERLCHESYLSLKHETYSISQH